MAASGNHAELKSGDVVRLKSGGPVMTAERVFDRVPRPFAHCAWFDGRAALHRAFVNLPALERADPEGPVSDEP